MSDKTVEQWDDGEKVKPGDEGFSRIWLPRISMVMPSAMSARRIGKLPL
ncbi:hypothetical protein [Mesorhizobium sp.]|nr:hypothetical protein [Mesorhizobium sp.]